MIKVGYDAGHGLFTPGKRTPDDEREWTFNNRVAVAFAAELALYDGIETKRFDDAKGKTDISLQKRTDNALAWGAQYFLSFHHNAYLAKWGNHGGVETFIYTAPNTKSLALAKAIHPALVQAYGLGDRGIKNYNWHVVREMQRRYNTPKKQYEQTGIGVVLIEGGFMDSRIDIVKLRDDKVLESVGRMIAQALAKHLKLSKKQQAQEATLTASYEGKIGYNIAENATRYRLLSGPMTFLAEAEARRELLDDGYLLYAEPAGPISGQWRVQSGAYPTIEAAEQAARKIVLDGKLRYVTINGTMK